MGNGSTCASAEDTDIETMEEWHYGERFNMCKRGRHGYWNDYDAGVDLNSESLT